MDHNTTLCMTVSYNTDCPTVMVAIQYIEQAPPMTDKYGDVKMKQSLTLHRGFEDIGTDIVFDVNAQDIGEASDFWLHSRAANLAKTYYSVSGYSCLLRASPQRYQVRNSRLPNDIMSGIC